MPNHKAALGGRVLLVSAPWALFNRPSLPLGSLKAYVKANIPGFKVQADHLFLAVAQALGYQTYQMISRRVWRAESVFSALLYPERASNAESVFTRTLSKKEVSACNFNMLVDQVKQITDRWLASVDWSTLTLVGFSISFCQVTASLYLISQIKRICPAVPVVVGGVVVFRGKDEWVAKSIFRYRLFGVRGGGAPPYRAAPLFINPKKDAINNPLSGQYTGCRQR